MRTTHEDIQNKLHKGVVTFTFMKKDGKTLRKAVATLCQEELEKHPQAMRSSNDGSSSPKVQVFFDLEKKAYRSFQIGTTLDLIDFKEIVAE